MCSAVVTVLRFAGDQKTELSDEVRLKESCGKVEEVTLQATGGRAMDGEEQLEKARRAHRSVHLTSGMTSFAGDSCFYMMTKVRAHIRSAFLQHIFEHLPTLKHSTVHPADRR